MSDTFITDAEVKELEEKAREVRISIINMLAEAKSGHTGGPLGMADIFTALFLSMMQKIQHGKIGIELCFQMVTFVLCCTLQWHMLDIFL
jgi:hypothetical protein